MKDVQSTLGPDESLILYIFGMIFAKTSKSGMCFSVFGSSEYNLDSGLKALSQPNTCIILNLKVTHWGGRAEVPEMFFSECKGPFIYFRGSNDDDDNIYDKWIKVLGKSQETIPGAIK